MKNNFLKVIKNKKGQGLVEYLIIVALIAVATIGIMRVLGQNIGAQFANITYAVRGDSTRAEKVQVEESLTKKKDMSDFMNGSSRR